jgi:hypothetical protein
VRRCRTTRPTTPGPQFEATIAHSVLIGGDRSLAPTHGFHPWIAPSGIHYVGCVFVETLFPRFALLVVTTFYDTIGSAFSARATFADLAEWNHLLLITEEFHMPPYPSHFRMDLCFGIWQIMNCTFGNHPMWDVRGRRPSPEAPRIPKFRDGGGKIGNPSFVPQRCLDLCIPLKTWSNEGGEATIAPIILNRSKISYFYL